MLVHSAALDPRTSVVPDGVTIVPFCRRGNRRWACGAALGALIVGLVRSAAVHYLPEVELFSIYLVMALVLIIRPKGLFSAAEARKI
jgi:hypothetical protein